MYCIIICINCEFYVYLCNKWLKNKWKDFVQSWENELRRRVLSASLSTICTMSWKSLRYAAKWHYHDNHAEDTVPIVVANGANAVTCWRWWFAKLLSLYK